MLETMKVRDLLPQEIDIDVYDDVCEELAIAFCGPLKLTKEGEREFAEVLDYEIELATEAYGLTCAVVHVDDTDEKVWKRKLRKAKNFFYAAAGYCDCDDYDRWFEEED